jgi:transcriptional regulator with XRE-family HTH domain
MKNIIGMNLQEARKYLDLTVEQVAAVMHMEIDDIKAYESGEKCPDSRILIKFSKLYGVSCLELLTEHDFSLSKDERAVAELLKMVNENKKHL